MFNCNIERKVARKKLNIKPFSYKLRQKDIIQSYIKNNDRSFKSPQKPVKVVVEQKVLRESLSRQQMIDFRKIESAYHVNVRQSQQLPKKRESNQDMNNIIRRQLSNSVDLKRSSFKSQSKRNLTLNSSEISLTEQKILSSPLVTKEAMANKSLQDAHLNQILQSMRRSLKSPIMITTPQLSTPKYSHEIESLTHQKAMDHIRQASTSKTYKMGFGLRSPKDLQPLKAFPLKINNCECNEEFFRLNDYSMFDKEQSSVNKSFESTSKHSKNYEIYKEIGLRTLQATFKSIEHEMLSKNNQIHKFNINQVKPELQLISSLRSPSHEVFKRPERLTQKRANSTLQKIHYPVLKKSKVRDNQSPSKRYNKSIVEIDGDSLDYFDRQLDEYGEENEEVSKNLQRIRTIRFQMGNTIIGSDKPPKEQQVVQSPKVKKLIARSLTINKMADELTKAYRVKTSTSSFIT